MQLAARRKSSQEIAEGWPTETAAHPPAWTLIWWEPRVYAHMPGREGPWAAGSRLWFDPGGPCQWAGAQIGEALGPVRWNWWPGVLGSVFHTWPEGVSSHCVWRGFFR